MHKHIAAAVLMVEPTTFGFDTQTAATNTFQHHMKKTAPQITAAALAEFAAFAATLRAHDIEVLAFRDPASSRKPDAVFPNNWLTTWPDGTVYTYPMATPVRRAERSEAALDLLRQNFQIAQVADLSPAEQDGAFLEGTGAIVFDHPNRRAFACLSPRCDQTLFAKHAAQLGYEPVIFQVNDPAGTPVYHTNVVLGIQDKTAVLYGAGIAATAERQRVVTALADGGREVIDITFEQVEHFCGNLLELQNKRGETFVVLSQTAFDAFSPQQRAVLQRSGKLLPVAIPTIETVGGGSARCMLAEIFLPRQ